MNEGAVAGRHSLRRRSDKFHTHPPPRNNNSSNNNSYLAESIIFSFTIQNPVTERMVQT